MPITAYSSPIDQNKLNTTDPSIDLGKIEIQKSMSRLAAQKAIQDAMQVGARPSSIVTRPTEVQQLQDNSAKKSFLTQLLETAGLGMMSYAEGMGSGKPYSIYMENKAKQEAAQQAFRQQQMEMNRKLSEDASQAETRSLNAEIMRKQLELMGGGKIGSANINGMETPLGGNQNEEDYITTTETRSVRGIPTEVPVRKLKPVLPPAEQKAYRGIMNTELVMKQNLDMLAKKPELEKFMTPMDIRAWKGGNPIGALGNLIIKIDPKSADWGTFKAETDKAFQTFRKETTGAQAALAELGWLAPDYPEADDNPTLYKKKATVAIQRIQEAKDMLQKYWGANYRVGELKKQDVGSSISQSKYTEGQKAFNPKTGQTLTFTNGEWK